jgi:Putative DNA-binding domain
MSLLGIPLDKINEADIRNLISVGVGESPYLDYKQQIYGDSGDDRSEFLADISSFANTLGGDLVIGVAESGGLPTILTPVQGDCDQEIRRLEQIALSGLEPRIRSLGIRAIPVSAGGHVVIVRVPRSFNPPHRVIVRNSNRFWARAGTTKYQPNVEQLRHLFTDAPHLAERIRAFQTDRVVKITAGDTPIPFPSVGKVVVHVVPLPSFADGRLADIVSVVGSGIHIPVPLDEIGFGNRTSANLEGFINYTYAHEGARVAYAQFFRNGSIEGVGELRHEDGDDKTRFVGRDFTMLVVRGVRQYLQVLKSYDVGLPIYIFLSLCNAAKTVYRHSPEGLGWTETPPLRREVATFPEIVVDSFDVDVPAVMHPAFNMLWNAFGLFQCDMYDGQGKWRGESR